MKIMIKGAGDLATGIASRLYRCGHQILMTEIAVPLTVRRQVALSRAVYEQEAVVEDLKGVLVHSLQEVHAVQDDGNIAVIVDEKAAIADGYHPDILIDAILAKKNLGTRITDAPFVIGVGPGFTAGRDCHCVVETKRGHTLGSVLWEGSAIPNTGVPGNVGGYTIERLIRATAAGVMEPAVAIGDLVTKGQVVAVTGGSNVYAQMTGIVRGMLQPGVLVSENLKIGDIDARCELFHCYTISDKARAIGGGALEAVTLYEHMQGKYALVVLAAGRSLRFGQVDENKLKAFVQGKPLYRHMLEKLQAFSGCGRVVVTGYEEIAEEARMLGIHPVMNREPDLGIAHSLKLGILECLRINPQVQGILFSVCDQPNLKVSTIQRMLNLAEVHPGRIVCAGSHGRTGNPVLWDRRYFSELLELLGDVGGRQLMNQYKDRVLVVETDTEELKDIDRKTDIVQ